MSDTKKYTSNTSKHYQIGCDAKNCSYNEEGQLCNAEHIDVSGQRAETEGETRCSTFRNKGSAQM